MTETPASKTHLDLSFSSQLSPSPNQSVTESFKENLSKYIHHAPTPSPSPLKRKSLSPDIPTPYSAKRITRSASSASLRTAAIANQQIFPPPVDLSPPPVLPKYRAVSSPSPRNTPPAKRRKSETVQESPTPSSGNLLRDTLAPNLHILFVGVNPGLQTAATGYAYAHPSNRFYPLLYEAGITPQRCNPSEYRSLVDRYGLGHTNIVTRPTRDASVLSKKEMEDGVAIIEEKVRSCKPGCVVMVGKSVWEAVERVWKREGRWKADKPFKYGWLDAWIGGDDEWEGARVFAATSTSGLAATVSWQDKVTSWKELGAWYQERVTTQEKNKENTLDT